MNTTKVSRWMKTAVLGLMVLGLAAGQAMAADPDSDSLTIAITPTLDFGVQLDTAATQMEGSSDLTTSMLLNATSFMLTPATMTILGDFNDQEVSLTAQGLDGWTVDTDEIIGSNSVQVYALFALNKSTRPLELEFDEGTAQHLITGAAAKVAGEPSGSEGNSGTDNTFEIATGAMSSGADMDGMAVGTQRQLWLRVDTPSDTSVTGAQRIQVTLTAANGSGI